MEVKIINIKEQKLIEMKKLSKLFAFMICCTMAVSLTSCLGTDDDGGIDPETYQLWLSQMSGNYYGGNTWQTNNRIYFINDTITDKNNENKIDSITGITASYYKGDSTLVVNGVPGRLLAKEITDNDALKKALEEAYSQNLKAKFVIYNILNSSLAYYLAYPYEITYPSLQYNGETHKVTFKFYPSSLGGYMYTKSSEMHQVDFYLMSIYIDDKLAYTICSDTNNEDQMRKALIEVIVAR